VPIDIEHGLVIKYVVAWRNATRSELVSLHIEKILSTENLPLGRNIISNKMVSKEEAKLDGSVDRFKARRAA
jgi:hypothetical protein